MNILVLGNGFDLAHELPTKYTDFLEWIVAEVEFWEDLKKENDEIASKIEKIPLKLNIPKDMRKKIEICGRIEKQVELWNCINSNVWLEYFLQCDMHGEENWIDFESEISEVIQSIDRDMRENHFYSNIIRLSNEFFIDEWRYGKIINTDYYNSLIKKAEAEGTPIYKKKMVGLTDFGERLKEICLE